MSLLAARRPRTHRSDLSSLSMRPQFGGRRLHRLNDRKVSGAATYIAAQRLSDRPLVRVGILRKQICRRHEKTRRAETALQSVLFGKAGLQDIETIRQSQALYGMDRLVGRLRRQHRAGFNGASIKKNRASTAIAGIAADVRS